MSSFVVRFLLVSGVVYLLLSSSSVHGLRHGPTKRLLGSEKTYESGHNKERRVQEGNVEEGGGCQSCRGRERDCGGCSGGEGICGNCNRGGGNGNRDDRNNGDHNGVGIGIGVGGGPSPGYGSGGNDGSGGEGGGGVRNGYGCGWGGGNEGGGGGDGGGDGGGWGWGWGGNGNRGFWGPRYCGRCWLPGYDKKSMKGQHYSTHQRHY